MNSLVLPELTPGAPLQHLEVSTPLTDVFRVNFISSPTLQSRSFTLSTVDDASEEPNEVAILSLAFVSDQRVMTGPDTQLVIVDDEEFGKNSSCYLLYRPVRYSGMRVDSEQENVTSSF